MRSSRFPAKQSPELKAAIKLQDKANAIAKVESRKPMRVRRLEANIVRKELMHDATMTKKQRSRAERDRQERLKKDRQIIAARKRAGELLKALPSSETKTETGIVLPSGEQIGKVLSRVSGEAV